MRIIIDTEMSGLLYRRSSLQSWTESTQYLKMETQKNSGLLMSTSKANSTRP